MKRWRKAIPVLAVLLIFLIGFAELQYTQSRQWERLDEIQDQLRAMQDQMDSIDRADSRALHKQLDEIQAQIDSMAPDSVPTVSSSEIVYVTPSGGSYHKKNCSFLANSKTIWERTEAEAVSQGYTACSRCQP